MDHHPFINFNMITYLINLIIHHINRYLINLPFNLELIHFIIISIELSCFNIIINFNCFLIIDIQLIINLLLIIHHPFILILILIIIVLIITLDQYYPPPSNFNYLKFPFIKFY